MTSQLRIAVVHSLIVLSVHLRDAAAGPTDVVKVTVSRETTFATSPKKPDGSLDFERAAEALFEKCDVGDNAVGPLLDSLSRSEWGDADRQTALLKEFGLKRRLKWVGLAPLEEFLRSRRKSVPRTVRDGCFTTPWDDAEQPAIAEWVDANEEPLATARKALGREGMHCSIPRSSRANSLIFLRLPHVEAARTAAQLLLARAMRCIRRKDSEGAQRELVDAHRFALIVGRVPSLAFNLTSVALDAKVYEAEAVLASSGLLDAAAMRQRAEKLHRRREATSPAAAIEGLDRLAILQSAVAYFNQKVRFRAVRHSGELPTTTEEADAALKLINQTYDRLGDALRKPDSRLRLAAARDVTKDLTERFFLPAKGRGEVGRLAGGEVLAQLAPATKMLVEAHVRLQVRRRFAETALLVEAERRQYGGYPRNLDSLLGPKFAGVNVDPLVPTSPFVVRATPKGMRIVWKGVDGVEDNPMFNPNLPIGREEVADDLLLRLGDGAQDCDEFVEARLLRLRPWIEKFASERDDGDLDRLAASLGKRAVPREKRWTVEWKCKDLAQYARRLDAYEVEIAVLFPDGTAKAVRRVSDSAPRTGTPRGVYLPKSGADHDDWNRELLRKAGIDPGNAPVAHFVPTTFELDLWRLEYARTPIERNCANTVFEASESTAGGAKDDPFGKLFDVEGGAPSRGGALRIKSHAEQ